MPGRHLINEDVNHPKVVPFDDTIVNAGYIQRNLQPLINIKVALQMLLGSLQQNF